MVFNRNRKVSEYLKPLQGDVIGFIQDFKTEVNNVRLNPGKKSVDRIVLNLGKDWGVRFNLSIRDELQGHSYLDWTRLKYKIELGCGNFR